MAFAFRLGPFRFGRADPVPIAPEQPFTGPHPSYEQTLEAMEKLGERLACRGPAFTAPHPSFARTPYARDAANIRIQTS